MYAAKKVVVSYFLGDSWVEIHTHTVHRLHNISLLPHIQTYPHIQARTQIHIGTIKHNFKYYFTGTQKYRYSTVHALKKQVHTNTPIYTHTHAHTHTHHHLPVRPRSPQIMLFISSLIPFAEMMSWKHKRNPVN